MIKFKTLAAAAVTAAAFTVSPALADAVVPDVATNNGVLTGSVVDAAGQPQAGVAVDVIAGGRVVASATTAADGSYRVAGLTSGNYGLAAEGQTRTVRVWSGIAPAGALQGVAIVSADETVNGNHGVYCPPAPCNDGGVSGGGVAGGGYGECQTTYAPEAVYSQGYSAAYTQCQPTYRTKSCGSSGFLSNGLSNTAAVAGLALGITGTAIAVDARDEAEHASQRNRQLQNDLNELDQRNQDLAAELERRGEIMDAREEFIENLEQRIEQLEQDLGAGGGGHVTP